MAREKEQYYYIANNLSDPIRSDYEKNAILLCYASLLYLIVRVCVRVCMYVCVWPPISIY